MARSKATCTTWLLRRSILCWQCLLELCDDAELPWPTLDQLTQNLGLGENANIYIYISLTYI